MRFDARGKRGYAAAMEVFLNGKPLQYCVAFDSDEGWAETYVLNERGSIARPPPGSDELPTERRHGTVTYVDHRPPHLRGPK